MVVLVTSASVSTTPDLRRSDFGGIITPTILIPYVFGPVQQTLAFGYDSVLESSLEFLICFLRRYVDRQTKPTITTTIYLLVIEGINKPSSVLAKA